jgi:hypothetical protein
MKDKDYLPNNDEELQIWLANFLTVFSESGRNFGITSAEIASLSALVYSVTEDIRNGRSKEKVAKKESVLLFVCKMIEKIKQHPSYTESAIGKKLGVD